MKNLSNIKPLSSSAMHLIRGGEASAQGIAAVSNSNASSVALSAVQDDKRSPRPGGGITTL